MFRFKSITVALAVIAAAACRAREATTPETASPSTVASVKIELARTPEVPLASRDTITVRAVVRDADGNLMPDISVNWYIRIVPGETDYIPAGVITQTGPHTAVVQLDAPQAVVVASAKGIFGELVLSLGRAP